jgi:hypothetical protein
MLRFYKKIFKKLFAGGARDSHARAGPHPPTRTRGQTHTAARARASARPFARLGNMGSDNPITWRASLRVHLLGWAFWVLRFGWHITGGLA